MLDSVSYFKKVATANQKLSKAKQIELWRIANSKTKKTRERQLAKEQLLNSTYALCLSIISNKRSDHMISLEEMCHLCIEAQERAFRLYNPDANIAFTSYLHTWVVSIVIASLKQMRVVSLPSDVSLKDAPSRLSMTGSEVDFDFSEESAHNHYPLQGTVVKKKRFRNRKVPKDSSTQIALF